MSDSNGQIPPAGDDYREQDVFEPDPSKPLFTTRPLVVYGEPVELTLEIVRSYRCYIVTEDVDLPEGKRLRRGQVLVRNLELTRRKGGTNADHTSHCFQVYDGIYSAMRGRRHIFNNYDWVEIKRLDAWHTTLKWLLHTSWALPEREPELDAEYERRALEQAQAELFVRDDDKVIAQQRTAASAEIDERAGGKRKKPQRNTARLAPLIWSARDLVEHRVYRIGRIKRRLDSVMYALVFYIDRLFIFLDRCDDVIAELSLPPTTDADRPRAERAERYRKAADRLRNGERRLKEFAVRPVSRSLERSAGDYRRAADAFEAAALALQAGNRQTEIAKRDEAVSYLERTRRSLVLLTEFHRPLENAHYTVSRLVRLKIGLHPEDRASLVSLLKHLRYRLIEEKFDRDFERPFTKRVIGQVSVAVTELLSDKPDLKAVKQALENACAPF